ncbi:UNVERIFIED_CONTAM: Kinesin-like protein KIN-14S [Sesamum radiatum]|uniref:Kinesin-like protein KIN-14S n=1 Tax=Sesamum radiatum TaxID=300843 RepID=A0AAW2MXR8_SESRA
MSDASNDTQEIQGQTLPIFQKIEDLSNKVQIIRKEHALLCNEVKGITADSLLDSEAFSALQNISMEHEHLKKKYHEECELLKKKYLEECSARKKLYNEVIELKGNIRVFCRCRPLKQDEIANGSTSVVEFDSSQENELQITCSDSSRKLFKFDHVFRPEDNQEAIFAQTLPIVTSVLDGYNVCIFAYGQTGTGKTYTMEGTPENRGVNYRTLDELFRISNERSSIMRYELFVSMLEVYNEKIRDLLVENSNQPVKKLEIKQSAEGTQEVPGLVEARVYGTDEAEKAKQDEKETKKLQESLQSLQLRLAAREHICRNLQEKVRDLENQLAEERKARLKQENRVLASISTQSALSTSNQAQKTSTDKKPPLAPSKLRLPLRRITNFVPIPSPVPSNQTRMSVLPVVDEDKENISCTLRKEKKARPTLKPRRGSIAVRPNPPASSQVLQPKRRASIATIRPESNTNLATPLRSSIRSRNDRAVGRQSFVWDPQRVWRTSRVSSPLPQSRELSSATIEATPVGQSSSKFKVSPPSQAGSWRPKHPTVVALHKKHLVWSPLKMRGMKSNNWKS